MQRPASPQTMKHVHCDVSSGDSIGLIGGDWLREYHANSDKMRDRLLKWSTRVTAALSKRQWLLD